MDVLDIFLLPLYLSVIYFFAYRTANKNAENPLYGLYYIKGLNYKLFGAIAFALLYIYYYKGGDTLAFFHTASPVGKLLFKNPTRFFEFVIGVQPNYPPECLGEAIQNGAWYMTRGSATLTTIRIAGVLDVFALHSFVVLTVIFAFISYRFIWQAFTLFTSLYPTLHKEFSYAFLMIPSVIFWGSGVGKDSIMLGSIMLFLYSFYQVFIEKRVRLSFIFYMVFCAYIITLIRGFILFTLVPCLLLMTVVYYRNLIQSSFVRFVVGPIFIVAGIGGSILFIRSLGESVESYKLDSLQQKAEGFKSWHSYLGETKGGSSYSLGDDFQYTPAGILTKAPLAILVTLFGPFVWQIRNFVMLLSGIESLAFLYFTFRIFFNRKIYDLFGILVRDHILVFCIPFILILSIAIGLTSFNYGALVRYKIPVLPFFASAIVIINYHLNAWRAAEE